MTIILLHSNKMEGEALSFLLKKEGYEVKIKPTNLKTSIPSLQSDFLLVIDTKFLFQMNKSTVQWLCDSEYHIHLIGDLDHFFWFFKLNCTTKSFFCKNEGVHRLSSNLEKLRNGDFFLSRKTIKFLKKEKLLQHKYWFEHDLSHYLTETELKIMLQIARGKTSQQIAEDFSRSHHTINNHRKNIMKKLNLEGTFSLIKLCLHKISSLQTLISLNKNQKMVKTIVKNN